MLFIVAVGEYYENVTIRILVITLFSSMLIITFPGLAIADNFPATGNDVSWPNCKASILEASWGVVGVNGGLVFKPSQCVHQESSYFSRFALYMNTGYPGFNYAVKYANNPRICRLSDNECLAFNFGFQAASYSLRYASLEGVHTNFWWLDVETVNSWSNDTKQNRAELLGMISAIKKSTLLTYIGFYSDKTQWKVITGNWENRYPNWVATGSMFVGDAIKACSKQSFNNGQTLLTQYTTVLDNNYSCDPSFPNVLKNS